MLNSKNSKVVGIILIVVIIACIAVLGTVGYNILKDDDKENNIEANNENNKTTTTVLGGSSSKANGTGTALSQIESTSTTHKKEYMEDYVILGEMEIPKIDLKTNILDETTKRSLEIAVAKIYTTSGLNQPGNTVIYGHNYRNSLFFSRNDELEKGDRIYITDEEGTKKTYIIYDIFETTSTDTSFYARTAEDTAGKCEVTLSTCTDDASATDRRLIILASEQ